MPLDHFVTLGRSGLRVSPFCLGGMTFGEERGWGSSVAESEEIIGDHVRRHPARRDRIVIATKFGISLFTGDFKAPDLPVWVGLDASTKNEFISPEQWDACTDATRGIPTQEAPAASR